MRKGKRDGLGIDLLKSRFLGASKALARFLMRHWAAVANVIFGLLAVSVGYQMWAVGLPEALRYLPRLIMYLMLIAAVLTLKYAVRQYARTIINRASAELREQVAGQVLQQGQERVGSVIQEGVRDARESLTSASERVKERWDHLTGARPSFQVSGAASAVPRCAACGRVLRQGAGFCDGCGAVVGGACPKCGRALRPRASFCDGCGAALHPRE